MFAGILSSRKIFFGGGAIDLIGGIWAVGGGSGAAVKCDRLEDWT
jgi:hypothetical protein